MSPHSGTFFVSATHIYPYKNERKNNTDYRAGKRTCTTPVRPTSRTALHRRICGGFLGASPNLAAESRKYAKESLEEYNGKKFAEAYAKLVVSKYFSNLAKFGKNIEPEIRAKLLASPELLDDFVSVLSPEDDAVKVYDILANIAKSSPEKFAKYPKLAIAVAVVFDTPPPKDWPHGQVSEKLLPRKLSDPVARFNQIVDMRERGKFLLPTEKMSIEELKYLVPSTATEDDAQWAQKSVSVSLSSIAYDHGRLNRKQFDWNGEDYRLKTIKTKGGICVDQAYYTMEVAKARGVPAFILSGAGSDGFHAWVAYMQRPGTWNFSVGRYENARFVTGKTYDPQTWKDATDHALESLREGFRNGAKYRLSEIHCAFADVFTKQNDYEKSLACAKAAVVAEPRNADAWNKIFAYLEKLGKSEREICQNYEFAVRAFSKYPDTDAEFRRKLADLYRKSGDISAAKRLTTSIILKTKNARPDIAMEFARRELEIDIQEGTAETADNLQKIARNIQKRLGSGYRRNNHPDNQHRTQKRQVRRSQRLDESNTPSFKTLERQPHKTDPRRHRSTTRNNHS